MALSRQTARHKRMQLRQSFTNNLIESSEADVSVTVHYDGKMMSNIFGRNIVDRVLVVISGLGSRSVVMCA